MCVLKKNTKIKDVLLDRQKELNELFANVYSKKNFVLYFLSNQAKITSNKNPLSNFIPILYDL